jgi:hypothetical protein
MYQFASKNMNCKLIILHYGLNVVGHESGDYSWYLASFRKTIKKIKSSFPNATIVLASVGDKAHKFGQNYHTETDIPLFVGMQVKLAKEENIVFWNMYKAMGGYDSMKRWVEENPKKAAKDYTHLNHAGAKEIATIAQHAGIDLFWGCNDESMVSITAALHIAYASPNTKYIDLDGSFDLMEDLVTGGFEVQDGCLVIHNAPGFGFTKF